MLRYECRDHAAVRPHGRAEVLELALQVALLALGALGRPGGAQLRLELGGGGIDVQCHAPASLSAQVVHRNRLRHTVQSATATEVPRPRELPNDKATRIAQAMRANVAA